MRVGDPGVDQHGVAHSRIEISSVSRVNTDVRITRQILPRPLGQSGIDVDGHNAALCTDRLSKNRSVITYPAASVIHSRAIFRIERRDPPGKSARLPIIQLTRGIDRKLSRGTLAKARTNSFECKFA